MSPLLLSVFLLAAPARAAPAPRAPVDAEFAFFIPNFAGAAELVPFLDVAAEHSGLLRREGWRSEVHPLLRVDVTRKDSLLESGLDPGGAGTLSFRGDLTFSCVQLTDPKKYEAACGDRLKGLGVPFRKELDGVSVVGAKDSLDRVLAGYVIRGKESCAIAGQGTSVEKPLLELGKLLGKAPGTSMWKNAAGLPGQAVLIAAPVAVGLKGSGLSLTGEFKSSRLGFAKLTGAGSSPYAGTAFNAMLWLRMRVEPSQLPPALAQLATLLHKACPACDPAVLTDAATALGPTLSGNVLILIEQVKVQGSLRTYAARFFAHKAVVLAEASDPKAAGAALEGFGRVPGAKPTEDGFALQLREGEVRIGVRQGHVYLSNDGRVLEATFRALPATAGKQAHGVEFGVDPERVAKALAQVPVVDVLSVPELAVLLGASAEVGPLLLASEKLSGYADTDAAGALRGQVVWSLKKTKQ